MQTVKGLIEDPTLWWVGLAFSAAVFVASLIAIPSIVVRLPADYFDHRRRRSARPTDGTWAYVIGLVAKNFAGLFFILIGLSMLVLPGQGLLTILIGLSLLNFPGKYRLERYLISRPPILRSLNWLRVRANQPPFVVRAAEQGQTRHDRGSSNVDSNPEASDPDERHLDERHPDAQHRQDHHLINPTTEN